LPKSATADDQGTAARELAERKRKLKLPEENLLYFIEKNSPALESWEREILRIVRNISQYFYPQKQTKMMNEGCATFVHHYIVNELYDMGLITEGALMEILHSHSNVIMQPGFDDPRYGGINPYALGFAMMQDIRRIVTDPTEEDRAWFPEIAGTGDWRSVLREAWANYRDESFIRQFLSPHLIREFKLFQLHDVATENHMTVAAIHDEQGYERLRDVFAQSYDVTALEPDIQIVDVNLLGDRELILHHAVREGIPLALRTRKAVLAHVRRLWGYDVQLKGIDSVTGETLYEVRSGSATSDGSADS
jgi:spore cortex formation protein SpoVR/YcgB (stage V sporulation)